MSGPWVRWSALLVCFLAMISDGFDLTVISMVMPAIAKEWGIQGMASFGSIFSAAILGVMVGAPLFGSVADRIGRKPTMLISLLFFALASFATTQAHSIGQLIAFRFVSGIGLGGLFPLAIVIASDLAPERLRATMIAIVTTGATLGAAISGFSAGWMVPNLGWRSLFILGGAMPLAIAIVAAAVVPETGKGAVTEKERAPDGRRGFQLRLLFSGSLVVETPLLWMLFIIVGTAIYFMHSWMPTLLIKEGQSIGTVGSLIGIFEAFGALGGLLIGWLIDRFGARPLMFVFLVAAPVLVFLALSHQSRVPLMTGMALAGLLLFALQVGMNGIAPRLYPQSFRGMGVGWAMGSVRVGQITGASGGGALIALGAELPALLGVLAALMLAGVAGSSVLALRLRRHHG